MGLGPGNLIIGNNHDREEAEDKEKAVVATPGFGGDRCSPASMLLPTSRRGGAEYVARLQ